MLESVFFNLAFRLFLRRCVLTATIFFGMIGVVSPQLLQGATILENFEEQTVGQFPFGWLDVREVDLSFPNPPDPSAVVIDTTDAFGSPTRALQFLEAAARSPGFSQGIFHSVDPGSMYQMKMHTRIDQFNNNPDRRFPGTDSPIIGGFVSTGPNPGTDLAFVPGIQLYVSTLEQDWRLFVRTPNTEGNLNNRWIPLNVPAELDKWYEVELDIFADTGRIQTRITDLAANFTLVDRVDDFSTVWDPSIDGIFDAAAFFEGEFFANNPAANIAVVDNILVDSVDATLVGDFDGDGVLSVADIDALTTEIVAGTDNPAIDLTGDGTVDDADLAKWRSDAAAHNGFEEAYLLGDSDLDGVVDSADLNNLALNWQQHVALWSGADFTTNGFVDAADLNALAINWQQSVPTASTHAPIPEPSSLLLAAFGLALVWRWPKCS